MWVAHSQLNLRQLEGKLLTYYDLSTQALQDRAQDLSKYQMSTTFTPKGAADISDKITWSYQEDNQIYQSSGLVDTKAYPDGFQHTFSRDKHLLFTRNSRLQMSNILRFDSEMTYELCYQYYDIRAASSSDYVL